MSEDKGLVRRRWTGCVRVLRLRRLNTCVSYRLGIAWIAAILVGALIPNTALTFDYEGHHTINQLALSCLPADYPAFVREPAVAERIAFLGGEPDRWRNSPDNTFKHWNGPDHYIDLDELSPLGLAENKLPAFRHLFTMQLAEAHRKLPRTLPPIDPTKNADHTRELIGYLPWTIAEHFSKLKSAFSSLKAFEEEGSADEITNVRQSVAYYMGVMGHYVADAAQPLHTTRHFNGWVGDNPKGYSISRGFHSWIDGGYLAKVPLKPEVLRARLRAARLIRAEDQATDEPSIFVEALAFIRDQHRLVEPLYQLDKDGKLSPDQPYGRDGLAFFEKQFVTASQMLADLWFTAWKEAPMDTYLKSSLARRKLAQPRSSS